MIPRPWTTRDRLILVTILAIGVAVRLPLLGVMGLEGDMREFAGWIHGIALTGLTRAYDQDLTFPPVMAFIWAIAGLYEPFSRSAAEMDMGARVVMKLPATVADFGIAVVVVWWFRRRPGLALAAGSGILLIPATWYVSAWWGQYESIYLLWAVLAILAARADRPHLAAALLALSVLTKPQALPFLVPFAAWLIARGGPRLAATAAATAAAVAIIAWAPFLAAGGPLNYLASIQAHQNETFNVLSLRAWNPWWLIQGSLAPGRFVLDGNALAGPVTFRQAGIAAAAIAEALVFIAVLRRPTIERLVLGMAAASLLAFVLFTTMHERYAYPAFVFLSLLIGDRRILVAWVLLGLAMTANFVAAAPAIPELGAAIPIDGPAALAGVVTITVVCLLATALLTAGAAGRSTRGLRSRLDIPSGT